MPPHMSEPAASERFHLELPSDPANLATARLFVATTARVLGYDEDAVADLKLAVSEAGSAVIASGRHETVTVVVETTPTTGMATVTVGPLRPGDLTGDHLNPGDVILALFPGAHIDETRDALLIPVEPEPAR